MANHAALICDENTGHPVANRGRRFIEFDLGGGKTRHIATIDPLHKRDLLTEIDATWYPDTGAWQWKIGDNDWQAHARDVFNVGSLIEWRHESGEWVIVDPQSINWVNQDYSRQQIAIKQAVVGIPNDTTLSFANAYGSGKHFSYIAHPRRLIKHFTIDNLSDLPDPEPWLTGTIHFEVEWTITNSAGVELWLDGVKWERTNKVKIQTSNLIEFRSETTGEVLWWADAPMATDANGDTIGAQYEIDALGGIYFIRVRVPLEWMQSAVYPVNIDPTFTDGYGGDVTTYFDTTNFQFVDTANYGTNENLGTGTAWRPLLRFDLSSLSGSCDDAKLSLYQTGSSGTTAFTLTAYSISAANEDWIEGTHDGASGTGEPCYAYKKYDTDAWAGTAGLHTSGTDYEAASLGSDTGNSGDANGTQYEIDLTDARIVDWFGGTNTNYGLLIDISATCGNLGSSDNATTGYRPKLIVEYSSGLTVILDTA